MTDVGAFQRRPLGAILRDGGVVTQDELEHALGAQSEGGRRQRLGATIVRLGYATEDDIATALAQQLQLERVDLASVEPTSDALDRIPRRLAERHDVVPMRCDGDTLVVAMADPTNVVALDDLRLTSGLRDVRAVVATPSGIADTLQRVYGSDGSVLGLVEAMSDRDVVRVDDEEPDLAEPTAGATDQPVIRLANAILADAVRGRASDVHVEPERDGVRIRFRIDGLLRESMRVPRHVGPALISRLKIMSKLDIAERRRPQDGRAMIRVEGQEVDLRVSTMPTLHGEVVVLRLLRKGAQRLSVDDLGLTPDLREAFDSALARPQGLIVITGPTGSGKTTTLYAGLTELTDTVRNIITLEDPVEYQLDGVNQTQINPKIDLTFARGLRTVLRQDPDVVMVGEIRDRETAELAMEASFTGHLVLSTLHTNDAPSTIVRLVDLGVERFLIASSLVLVVAQRLLRVVCSHCREAAEPDPRTVRLLGVTPDELRDAELVRGAGCPACDHTGYRGRIGAYEALVVTPEQREAITAGASELRIAQLARAAGMRTLREDGLAKALAGVTTLDEVARVTPDPGTGRTRPVDRALLEALRSGDQPAAVTPLATRRQRRDEDSEGEAAPVERRTILVVDDDDVMRELLAALLSDHDVVFARTGQEALDLHATHDPDAVILDHELPDTDGLEVTASLRERSGRRIPILMVTGSSDAELEVDGLLAGVDDFVLKPFDHEVLLARLHAALRRQQAG